MIVSCDNSIGPREVNTFTIEKYETIQTEMDTTGVAIIYSEDGDYAIAYIQLNESEILEAKITSGTDYKVVTSGAIFWLVIFWFIFGLLLGVITNTD